MAYDGDRRRRADDAPYQTKSNIHPSLFSPATSGGGGARYTRVSEDPVAAAAEEEEEPKKEGQWGPRALLVAGLVALPLLAFFILGRESASMVWEMATAKLTAINTGASTCTYTSLLGGLLAPGMDRDTCQSRYESWRYFKHFPYAPSQHLIAKLRAYEARHRRCAPGTPLYAKAIDHLKSGGRSAAADEAAMEEECRYVVWLPFDGLGNRMLSMASGFLYALLTDRVFLVALPPNSADLFCEPFPNTTWLLPPVEEFPVPNLFSLGPRPSSSYTNLLAKKKIVVDVDVDVHGGDAIAGMTDGPFFCGEHQAVLSKVRWLLLYSDLYFVPSLYPIAEFQGELRRMFPDKESVSHLLLRYLFHPSNPVWGMVTRYYHSYLAHADKRIGVQIRMFHFATVPADDLYNQILSCSRQEHILPVTDDDAPAPVMAGDNATATSGGDNNNNGGSNTTAILIASLYADYYERLKSRYYEHAAARRGGGGAVWVGVFQPTHEEWQLTGKLAHNQKALAEIFLLGFSDELVTSGMSTFGYVGSSLAGVRPTILLPAHGHKVPVPPCRRAVSMEPCNLTPPRGVKCRSSKTVDGEDLARHLKVCEDYWKGVKLFD
ncbi:hypothetical protein HU200_027915 [Digitaria exilis]|uniref:Fucosyltransferase n=1 Tax=Digitaria exilis TaxID=1010633 RepID=A0A835C0P1_9POAL|nr:hypothetical protein HU200_027915 [Digitaria exilis]